MIHINQYNTDKQRPGVSGLVTATALNTKTGEIKNKIPDTSGLATTTVLNTITGEVENKIPDVSRLVKKTDCNAKMSDIEKKHFTTCDYSKFTGEILDVMIEEKELVNKSNISKLVKILI